MKIKEKKWIRFRIYVVGTFFLIGLVIILARAFQLQILEKDRLETIARSGYIGTYKLPPTRGTIYDRENHELAISIECSSIYAHPRCIKEKTKTSRQLSRILGEKQNKLLKLLNNRRSFVWIKRRVTPNLARQIEALDLEGIGAIAETRRYYSGREVAAHVIGFAGSDNQGLEGLERRYDEFLKGPELSLIQMRDALGRPFTVSRPVASNQRMFDLILTIDKDIQYKAQTSLRSALKKTGAKSGQCLVLKPDTGEVLAMAVVPEFNPNVFSRYRPYEWRNRTITDCFEPGSTIKAFLLAACLEESIVTPDTTFYCEQGKYKVGGHVIHDTHKYGMLSVSDIVVYSSNIGAVKLGCEIGYPTFCEYLKKFGLGSKTGIDLLGERSGFIRPYEKAREIDQATLCFGQGMSVTSLQMAMAMSAIANGGKLMRPYVVSKIVDQAGRVVEETSPKVVRRVLSEKTCKQVTRILEGVVDDGGTAEMAAIKGFRVAGKTGTSQKVDPKTKRYSRQKYVATFVGFVPADQPKFVILVAIDEPKGMYYGGVVAAPVFREVGQWALNYLKVNPQTCMAKLRHETKKSRGKLDKIRCSGPMNQIARKLKAEDDPVKTGGLPDFRGLGMRDVLKKGRSLGLTIVLEGTGLAIKQDPEPGSSLERIDTVRINFRPPA